MIRSVGPPPPSMMLDGATCADNTWIVITSDHGEHFGEHGKYWPGNRCIAPSSTSPRDRFPPPPSRSRVARFHAGQLRPPRRSRPDRIGPGCAVPLCVRVSVLTGSRANRGPRSGGPPLPSCSPETGRKGQGRAERAFSLPHVPRRGPAKIFPSRSRGDDELRESTTSTKYSTSPPESHGAPVLERFRCCTRRTRDRPAVRANPCPLPTGRHGPDRRCGPRWTPVAESQGPLVIL